MGTLNKLLAQLKWRLRRQPDRVTVDHQAVRGWCRDTEVWTVPWDNLQRVQIETTDEGPWQDDCFMILATAGKRYRVASETPGFPNLIGGVTGELAEVDEEALLASMAFHENRMFAIWERSAEGPSAETAQ